LKPPIQPNPFEIETFAGLSSVPKYCLDFSPLGVQVLRVKMNTFGTWLMIFWMMAGLNVRVMASESHTVCVSDSHCCADHHDAIPENDTGDHDHESCPPESHHHHECTCSHLLPLSAETDRVCRLDGPPSYLLELSHESEKAPEKPYLQLEKPPLI
jgi:hypothetical protein